MVTLEDIDPILLLPLLKDGRTRIAPTPSGYLHAGNAVNFLIISKIAKATGSKVFLRIDDLDTERVRPEYIEDIFRSLEWLGIEWDSGPSGPDEHWTRWSQRFRLGRYAQLADALRERGLVYGCTCTRSQLREHTTSGIYPGTCRTEGYYLDDPDSVWRLLVPEPTMVEVVGMNGRREVIDLATVMGDPVIQQRRQGNEMGKVAFQIASLADDVDHGITWIVRGADLMPSTACQLHIARSLGLEQFAKVQFLHHRLEMDVAGRKLSKSEGATSLKAMREAGYDPKALERKAGIIMAENINP